MPALQLCWMENNAARRVFHAREDNTPRDAT